MRIGIIILASAGLAMGTAAPAWANGPAVSTGAIAQPAPRMGTAVHRWGPRYNGRWYAGWYAPGGWAAYRRPMVGTLLPRYWISPAYMIRNYGVYGLPVPAGGYGWSRYYDDAVMTDRDGRIRDYRSNVAWEDQPVPPGLRYDDDVTAPDAPPPPPAYEGRWSGTWRDRDGRTYSGDYEGRFEGHAEGRPGVDFDPPPYAAAPSPAHRPGEPLVTTTQTPGFIAGGYYYPGTTTTTVVIQPAVTTSRTYVTQVPSRKRRR